MNRRELIRGIGRAICAGAAVPFIPGLVGGSVPVDDVLVFDYQYMMDDLKQRFAGDMYNGAGWEWIMTPKTFDGIMTIDRTTY